MVIVDPFARNSQWGTPGYTNDLNPNTQASHHMDAAEFLRMLVARGSRADVILFDPPYSARQVTECYQGIGRKTTQQDTQLSRFYAECKELCGRVLKSGGIVLSFGWNSGGLGKKRRCQIIEVLLVCHGGSRNDTIVTVERKHWNSM